MKIVNKLIQIGTKLPFLTVCAKRRPASEISKDNIIVTSIATNTNGLYTAVTTLATA